MQKPASSAAVETPEGGSRAAPGDVDLRIHVTNNCNARCPYCLNDGVPIPLVRGGAAREVSRVLGLECLAQVYRAVVEVVGIGRLYSVCVSGGEPLVRPDLPVLLHAIAESAPAWWWLNTNASLLTRERIDALAATGLAEAKMNVPVLDPILYGLAMGFPSSVAARNLARVLDAVGQLLALGWAVDLNRPLIRGVNDALESLESYRCLYEAGATVKHFALQDSMYGTEPATAFVKERRMPVEEFISNLGAVDVGADDRSPAFLRLGPEQRQTYVAHLLEDSPRTRVMRAANGMYIRVAGQCDLSKVEGHPRRSNTVILTSGGALTKMGEGATLYDVWADGCDARIPQRVAEALALLGLG